MSPLRFDVPDLEPEKIGDWTRELASNCALWARSVEQEIENMVTEKHATLAIPKTTIDAGSSEVTATSAASAFNNFSRQNFPNTATTTAATDTTALSYTGRGVLRCVAGCSQVSGAASTAAGMTIKITIDDTTVYSAAALGAVNRLRAVVGSLIVVDALSDYMEIPDDPIGLPFNKSCTIVFSSGTAGQGVSIGWRISKKR